jgi:hypothetical protein
LSPCLMPAQAMSSAGLRLASLCRSASGRAVSSTADFT